ncbi:hypothetical protein OG21DRAFT_1489074 [Imleria badia]|nr:hypothetical protein OG21DRAFT_1489074 [Imleria badia]
MSPESREGDRVVGMVFTKSSDPLSRSGINDDNAELNTSNNETVDVQEESPILPVKKYDSKQRRADTRRPQTPAMVTSSSRANPIAGRPALPLESILKGSKNVQPHDSYESEGEILTSKKVARSQYNIPNVLPPRIALGPRSIYTGSCFPNSQRSRRFLRFDVAFPVDEIVFQDGGIRTKLSDAELDRRVAHGTMTRMLITFEHKLFYWEMDVKNIHGIRCRDMFEAIYKGFNEQLTTEERLVRDRRAVADAFRPRCSLSPGLPAAEPSSGWKRVDVLLHRMIFLGLTRGRAATGS